MNGAVFIYRRNHVHDEEIKGIFEKKGFSSARYVEIPLGVWYALVYGDLAGGLPEIYHKDQSVLFWVGNWYCNCERKDAIQLIIDALSEGKRPSFHIGGQYTFFCYSRGKLRLLSDPLFAKHIFTNKSVEYLSTSFLAACFAEQGKLHLSASSVCEKLMTGYIISPDTLIKEIYQIEKKEANRLSNLGLSLEILEAEKAQTVRSRLSKEDAVKQQLDVLQQSWDELYLHQSNSKVDLGISGGYDSRLVLAFAQHKNWLLHLHTHQTGDIHNDDLKVAKALSEYINIPLKVLPTKRPEDQKEEIEDMLIGNLLFFDGRSAAVIGEMSQTYTLAYRKLVIEESTLELLGIGGEIYRNYYLLPFVPVWKNRFFKDRVFRVNIYQSINDKQWLKNVIMKHIHKAEDRMHQPLSHSINKEDACRYYGEVYMADGQSVMADAYDQICPCFLPFLDDRVLSGAQESAVFQGIAGRFEGYLIEKLDPNLAKIPSSYGYSFAYTPLLTNVKETLRTLVPPRIWNKIGDYKRRSRAEKGVQRLEHVLKYSGLAREGYRRLCEYVPQINMRKAAENIDIANSICYISIFLSLIGNKVEKEGN